MVNEVTSFAELGVVVAVSRPSDSGLMRQLARDAYLQYVELIGREPAPMTSDYEAIAATGDALLALKQGALVGMIVTRLEKLALLIENIAVAPAEQGTGLGSLLLAEAERKARESGRTEVRLYTNAAMTQNLAYYPRRGYRQTHRENSTGFDRVHFAKRLSPPN